MLTAVGYLLIIVTLGYVLCRVRQQTQGHQLPMCDGAAQYEQQYDSDNSYGQSYIK